MKETKYVYREVHDGEGGTYTVRSIRESFKDRHPLIFFAGWFFGVNAALVALPLIVIGILLVLAYVPK